jgi:DNA-binding GntR family transcriptional regulator
MHDKPDRIHRRNLSDDLADRIREMIFDGRLEGGQRINEVHLARDMGVSRTPLREALSGLVAEGTLSSVPRHGFFVQTLSLEEATQIYPIRGFLDPEALRLAGLPSRSRLHRLEKLRLRLENCTSVRKAIDLDDQWHRELWAECGNGVLTGLIEHFMSRTRRYELASMRQATVVATTARSKKRIQDSLENGDLEGACELLRRSLINGGEPVFAWLKRKDQEDNE